MQGSTIVIIGAGSIGLCVAYNLAKQYQEANSTKGKTIIVIDALSGPFKATSATNTGCLHYVYPPEQSPLLPLGRYSYELWEDLASRNDHNFAIQTGYRPHSFFWAEFGHGEGQDGLPNWAQLNPEWDIDKLVLGKNTALVNPVAIGKWLAERCESLGVKFQHSFEINGVDLLQDGRVRGVHGTKSSGHAHFIPCDRLVLAAGPWTPVLFKKLFPRSELDLTPRTNAADWMIIRNPFETSKTSIAAVLLENIVQHKLEFAGRNDGTIWCCGRRNYDAVICPIGQTAEPDPDAIAELVNYTKKYVKSCSPKVDELDIVKTGRSFRPATASELPTISAVSVRILLGSNEDDSGTHNRHMSGVYMCWGHGSWGIGLGMGSGKLMAQIIRGEKPDIDLSDFTIA